MADSDIKKKKISFPESWLPHTSGCIIGQHQYKPDRSFKDSNGNVVCVIESSSTNDRKVGVGELCLADQYFSEIQCTGILIFSLYGKSKYPPKPDTQAKYIEPYFKYLKSLRLTTYGVKEVYFISEEDFESLGWHLMKSFAPRLWFLRLILHESCFIATIHHLRLHRDENSSRMNQLTRCGYG